MDNMLEIVQDHEKRIGQLETSYVSLQGKLTSVENGQLKLENTILTEFKEQKDLTNKLINHQFGLDRKKLSGKEKIIITLITTFGSMVGVGGMLGLFQLFVK